MQKRWTAISRSLGLSNRHREPNTAFSIIGNPYLPNLLTQVPTKYKLGACCLVSKKLGTHRKATKRSSKKARSAKPIKTRKASKIHETNKPLASVAQVISSPVRVDPLYVEAPKVTIGTIRGDTVIGDLLVAFPRTREVLVRTGLRLEAEDAGDIYMTLDAFSAMNDLKTEKLVIEIVEVAKQPIPQPVAPQLVAAPTV